MKRNHCGEIKCMCSTTTDHLPAPQSPPPPLLVENGQPVPEWLHDISDLYAVLKQEQQQEEGSDAETVVTVPVGAPPICASATSRNLERMYVTLSYFSVPFEKVPAHFLEHWFGYRDAASRQALLEQFGAYRTELDDEHWRKRMFQRDDTRLLSILVQSTVADRRLVVVVVHNVLDCAKNSVVHGAIHCLDWLYDNCPKVRERSLARQIGWLACAVHDGRVALFRRICERWDVVAAVPHTTPLWGRVEIVGALMWCRHLPMLQFAHEQGWSKWRAAWYFARRGNTAALGWLRSVGGAPDMYKAYHGAVAARSGVVVLEYLRTHDWPRPSPETVADNVGEGGGLGLHAVVDYEVQRVMRLAVVNGDALVVHWLWAHGWARYPQMLPHALRCCSITDAGALHAFLDALVDMGCGVEPPDATTSRTAACAEAVRGNRSVETIEWLISRGHALSEMALVNTLSVLNESNGLSLLDWISAAHPPTNPALLRSVLIYDDDAPHNIVVPVHVVERLIVRLKWPCNDDCLWGMARKFTLGESHYAAAECLRIMDMLVARGCHLNSRARGLVLHKELDDDEQEEGEKTKKEKEVMELRSLNRDLLKAWLDKYPASAV